MNIVDKLTESVQKGVKELYGQEVPTQMIQLQKTKKEFEGHLTLVVFPFLKLSKKGPEQTAQEIGEYLKQHETAIASYNVIKGFLNLTIASDVWIELLNRIHADAQWGIRKAADDAPLVMIEYSSPNTNKRAGQHHGCQRKQGGEDKHRERPRYPHLQVHAGMAEIRQR